MTTRRDSCSLLEKCVFLLLVIAAYSVTADEECDPLKCPGPLRYYRDLGCKPVYKNEGDCCAARYNCDHLKSRAKDKCYVNGKEYSIGERLREEDSNPCDIGCLCREGRDGVASFICAIVDCFHSSVSEPNCYFKDSVNTCCRNEKVCVENIEDLPKCEVDDQLFYGGESFYPKSDPDLHCVCLPGYTGENVEPFCKKPNRPYCGPEFTRANELRKNCAPVFFASQPPQTGCNLSMRCQNTNDTVINNHEETKGKSNEEEDETMMCKLGDLKMYVGDKVDESSESSSICVKCVCEVPPSPTCIQYHGKADLSCRNTKQSVGAIYTRTNFVTLRYVTDAWGTSMNGFRLVITAVKDPKHTCKDFRCTQNEFCIETDLLCDGVNHCSDGSDETPSTLCANSEASTILGMQTTWFAVALVFLILSMAGLVTAAVLCFCRQRASTPRHPHNAHNAQTHPPVSFPWIRSSWRCARYVLIRREVSLDNEQQHVSSSRLTVSSRGCLNDDAWRKARPVCGRFAGVYLESLVKSGRRRTSKMSLGNGFNLGKLLVVFGLLVAVTDISDAAGTLVTSNVDNDIAKDYFIGPCLVNTNQTCPDDEVTFFLYTKKNPDKGQRIVVTDTDSNIDDTYFDQSNPTKIIVHGYNSDMQMTSLIDVRNEYLKTGEYNLIAVDWHRLAVAPCYPIAVYNVPHVGECLAQLIRRLEYHGAREIHVIGFSLGAHVPALSANYLRPYRLSRITGLDPAMPLYVTVGTEDKLDASDAQFVDVYHTNAFVQGKIEPSGHIDFYMNGGVNQPGCWDKRNPFGCNHHRAAEYFAESINSKKGFWGWPCPGFVSYLLGLCPPRYPAVLAGDRVDRRFKGFHLVTTRAESPYAEGVFHVNPEDMPYKYMRKRTGSK